MEEKELFEDYEIKNWEFTPRLFKMFGVGALLTFATVFAFGQFNLAQSKACDNAIVGTFCQVLDAAYIAATFANEDAEWTSKDYVKETIQDADITYVDVSAVEPPLKYPEGYFAIANPEQFSQMPNPADDIMGQPFPTSPSFPSTTMPNSTFPNSTFPNSTSSTDMLSKPAELPKQNNNAIKGEIPDSPFSIGDDSSITKPTPNRSASSLPPRRRSNPKTPRTPNRSTPSNNDLANANTNTNSSPEIKTESTPTDTIGAMAQFNEKFNKKPLQDFANEIIDKTDGTEKIDLRKPFKVEMQGVLDKNGKLDIKKSSYIDDDGDPNMINVAKSAIEAVNSSGLLSYLRDQGVENITFILVQDDKQINAVIKGNLPTEEKARTVSSGINGLIGIAKLTNRDDDLKKLMDAAKFTTESKNFVMNFALPKEDAHKLIDKKLQEARLKKSQGTNEEVTSNANARTR